MPAAKRRSLYYWNPWRSSDTLREVPRNEIAFQRRVCSNAGSDNLLHSGEFGLPTKYLQERGIKGEKTISKAKKKLVEVGFLDVVQQGSFVKAGRFRYFDRWRTYNFRALFKEDGTPCSHGPLPRYCHYPNIIQHNQENGFAIIEGKEVDPMRFSQGKMSEGPVLYYGVFPS